MSLKRIWRRILILIIIIFSYQCGDNSLPINQEKISNDSDSIRIENSVIEKDSNNGVTFIYQVNTLGNKNGIFVALDSLLDTIQKGFFINEIPVGYMDFYRNDSLIKKRSFRLGIDGKPTVQDFIEYSRGGLIDTSNSCFVSWNAHLNYIIPEVIDTFRLMGKLICPILDNNYHTYEIVTWESGIPDTTYVFENVFDIPITTSHFTDDLFRLDINFISGENDSLIHHMHTWYFKME